MMNLKLQCTMYEKNKNTVQSMNMHIQKHNSTCTVYYAQINVYIVHIDRHPWIQVAYTVLKNMYMYMHKEINTLKVGLHVPSPKVGRGTCTVHVRV